MLIRWIGHSCFLLTTQNGTKILTDPYDNSIGLAPVIEHADIVLVSHDHFDHNYTAGITGDYTLINTPGTHEALGIKITGFKTFHDPEHGKLRGENIVNLIEADNMRILHMGDIGTMPDDSFFESVGNVDILMIPVGGVYTVDAKGALAIMERLRPNITIPMHFKTPELDMDIEGVHEFSELSKKEYDRSTLGNNIFEITADSLKKRKRIIIMDCSNCD